MKKHIAKTLGIIALCTLMVCIFAACQVTTTAIAVNGEKQVYAGEFDLANYTLTVTTSDGKTRTEPLSEKNITNTTVEQLQQVGTHTITAEYDGATTTFTLTVINHTFEGITFANKTVTYSGAAQTIEVVNLPQGATVSYSPANSYTNAGAYTVEATVSALDFDTIKLTATLTIEKATYDMSKVVFENKSVTYDGSVHSLEATNLPDGVTVTYQNNGQVNAGNYTVTACFAGDEENYNAIANKTATLTIEKATYDMSQVVFENKSVTYDGNTHSLEATNLPDGVTVTYIGNNQTNVGTYNVVAIFSGDSVNYNPIANKTATLTITQSSVQGITFQSRTLTYDGVAHSLAIDGTLPQGIAVIYENNNQTNAGVYTVTAKFIGSNPNYEQLSDMTATLTIEKRELTIEFIGSTTVAYDGNAHKSLTARATNLCGIDTVNISITYSGDVVEAGSYTATATVDSANYKLTQNNTCTITITRATHTVTFRQQGQEGKVFSVLDLADFAEPIPQVVPVTGYTVVWETKNLTRVTEDIVVNAIITPVEYGITYVLDGGTNSDEAPDSYTIESATFALPTPTKYGYTFDGWYMEDTFENKVEQIANGSIGDVTLYAKWTITTYSLTIDLDGGTLKGDLPSQFTVNDLPLTLPRCYKKDYTFEGWVDENNEKIEQLTEVKNVAITATFAYGTEGLMYSWQDDYGIVSGYNGTETDVVIPATWKNVTIKVIGGFAFNGCSSLVSISLPNSIEKISSAAFQECVGLTNISILDSVESIGNQAFYNCIGLTNVIIGNGVTSIEPCAFYGTGLTSITIPENVTKIGYDAFYNCEALTTVNWNAINCESGGSLFNNCENIAAVIFGDQVQSIPNCLGRSNILSVTIGASVTTISSYTFDNCFRLAEVVNNSQLNITKGSKANGYVGYYALSIHSGASQLQSIDDYQVLDVDGVDYLLRYDGNEDNLVLPNKFNSETYCIYKYAFNSSNLTSITITENVVGIESYAFSSCNKLTTVNWNVSNCINATSRSYGIFYACDNITTVNFGDNVQTIPSYVFVNCNALTTITIPETVNKIGSYVFRYCNNLTTVNWNAIDCKLTESGNSIFDGSSITTVNIGNKVKTIPAHAFDYCKGMTSIKIPDSVQTVGDGAFYNCYNLTNVAIGKNVVSIERLAFYRCSSLTTVKIPDKVEMLGESAFSRCTALTNVEIGTGITSIGDNVFSGCTNLQNVYYKGTAEQWSKVSVNDGNEYFTSATLYFYSATEPATTEDGTAYDGNYWRYDLDGTTIVVWKKENQ